jgi:hypothetical protein
VLTAAKTFDKQIYAIMRDINVYDAYGYTENALTIFKQNPSDGDGQFKPSQKIDFGGSLTQV